MLLLKKVLQHLSCVLVVCNYGLGVRSPFYVFEKLL